MGSSQGKIKLSETSNPICGFCHCFADELAITQSDDDVEEERFVTIGRDADWRVLVVVYTWRGEKIRLISARKATNSERRYYESEL